MSKKSIVLIPARGGSISIENKNLQTVNNVPLVCRSIRHAMELISEDSLICVSSDAPSVIETSIKFISERNPDRYLGIGDDEIEINNEFIIHRRPQWLSKADSSTWHLMEYLKDTLRISFGIVPRNWLILQPTTPFRSSEELDFFKQRLRVDHPSDMVSVRSLGEVHPQRMYKIANDGTLHRIIASDSVDSFIPRQHLSPHYIRDGGYYSFASHRFTHHGPEANSILSFERKFPFNINIDEPSDLTIAKSLPFCLYQEDPNEKI